MKNLLFTLKTLCLFLTLFATLPTQSMENNNHQLDTLENSMKNFLKLGSVCKKLNQILSPELISHLCKNYSLKIKNKTLLDMLTSIISDDGYKKMKLPASILISSGANTNVTTESHSHYLLGWAIRSDDLEFVEKLLQHKANPNPLYLAEPTFFWSKNRTMTQLLVNYGLDIHTSHVDDWFPKPNVLWMMIDSNYPSDLMAYYLEHGVDPRVLWQEKCLFHRIADPTFCYVPDGNDFLKKATLLINAMPDMINHTDSQGYTALDYAYNTLDKPKKDTQSKRIFRKFIALLKENGGLTGEELAQKTAAIEECYTFLQETATPEDHHNSLQKTTALEDYYTLLLSGPFTLKSMESTKKSFDFLAPWQADNTNISCRENNIRPLRHSFAEEWKKDAEDAQATQEYNDTDCSLTTLILDSLFEKYSHYRAHNNDDLDSLEKKMKNFIKLSLACKKLNQILSPEMIGHLCKNYSLEIKNKTLLDALTSITDDVDYKKMKLPASILISSGADANVTTECHSTYLLERAIIYNDLEFAQKLLLHKADPNPKYLLEPIFFWSKNRTMTQLLVEHGLDIHTTHVAHWFPKPNVLWMMIDSDYPSDLMAYYLERGVNPKVLWQEECLLHRLTNPTFCDAPNDDDFLKKATLLINAMPDMINHTDSQGKTALDYAYAALDKQKKDTTPQRILKQFITLLRENDGLTGQELAQKTAFLEQQYTFLLS